MAYRTLWPDTLIAAVGKIEIRVAPSPPFPKRYGQVAVTGSLLTLSLLRFGCELKCACLLRGKVGCSFL